MTQTLKHAIHNDDIALARQILDNYKTQKENYFQKNIGFLSNYPIDPIVKYGSSFDYVRSKEMLKLLFDNDADINQVCISVYNGIENSKPTIFSLIGNSNLCIFEGFLELGVDPNLLETSTNTTNGKVIEKPLICEALLFRRPKEIKCLLNYGIKLDKTCRTENGILSIRTMLKNMLIENISNVARNELI